MFAALGLHKVMSDTPLSDHISALVGKTSDKLVSEFHTAFINSEVGLIVNNLPELESGVTFTVSGNEITMDLVSDAEGNQLIKVCADPKVFENKFNVGINALMPGLKVIEMLLKTENLKGLLICSAASFHSYPIYLETAKKLASSNINKKVVKSWWAPWK